MSKLPQIPREETAEYKLAQITKKVYTDALEAEKRGELVCWCVGNAPVELLEAFDIALCYPENQAVAIAIRGGGERMCVESENYGYSNDICAYARIGMAFSRLKECPEQPMAMPDFLFCSNSICTTIKKWFESLAAELDIPMFLFDIPFVSDYSPSGAQIQYMKDQMKEAIAWIEQQTGKKLNKNRLKEVMQTCSRTSNAWMKATGYASRMPSPFNGFDVYNLMAPMLSARCKPETAEAMELLCRQYEDRIANGESSFPVEETYRIMFEGIPCWPYLKKTYQSLKNYGINMVTNIYGDSYAFVYDDLDEMCLAYCMMQNNMGFERIRDVKAELAGRFQVDGLLTHINRSCKPWTGLAYELGRTLGEDCNIVTGMFDGDQADPRNFSEAQFQTRLQGFAEILEAEKEEA